MKCTYGCSHADVRLLPTRKPCTHCFEAYLNHTYHILQLSTTKTTLQEMIYSNTCHQWSLSRHVIMWTSGIKERYIFFNCSLSLPTFVLARANLKGENYLNFGNSDEKDRKLVHNMRLYQNSLIYGSFHWFSSEVKLESLENEWRYKGMFVQRMKKTESPKVLIPNKTYGNSQSIYERNTLGFSSLSL